MVERLKPKQKDGHRNRHPDKRKRPRVRKLGQPTAYQKRKSRPADYVPQQSRNPYRNGGRKKGIPNGQTTFLKDAILKAAELEGSDQHGLDKLVGYLRMAAREYPKNFLYLLGRVLPYQVALKSSQEEVQGISRTMTHEEAAQTYVDTLRGLHQGLRGTNLIDVTPTRLVPPPSSNGQLKDGS